MIAWLALAAAAGCAREWRAAPPIDAAAHLREIDAFHAQRRAELTGPTGWLALVGLSALPEGASDFGADSSLAVRLPAGRGPVLAGRLVRAGARVTLEPAPGVRFLRADSAAGNPPVAGPLDLRPDADSAGPTDLLLGALRLRIHAVQGRAWLRVWDEEAGARRSFTGVPAFPVAQRWRLAARFEPLRVPGRHRVPDITGGEMEFAVPGELVFRVDGREFRLLAFDEPSEHDLWVLFGDSTNARTTYGAGRYIHVPLPDSAGWTVLDFNRAYNPPCAFNAFATCPLPPMENRLRLAVAAGETKPH
jgi:hypothetical protein